MLAKYRELLEHNADIGVSLDELLDLAKRTLTPAAIVVEVLYDRDITLRISKYEIRRRAKNLLLIL